VYAALDRMERKGLLRSDVGDPTPVRGGRAKRFYELQASGAEALRRSREVLSGLWDGLTIDPESFA
jgi:DNA-binding PadR family transcriptional regulator